METFSQYVLDEKIHESRNSIVYRGHKENESQNVIIKVLKTKYPTPSEIARFKQEYNLVKNFNINGIIKIYDLVEYDSRYAIIEEDFDGVSLKEIINTKNSDLKSLLQIAVKISETLGILHKNNIIHLDIKPENILINTKQNAVKITNFGISSVLTHANDEIYNPEVIQGTLSYMSPEQTDRMNRNVDYRTDLYSLGVTFYEMLTNEVPFKSTDPMELIHSLIARQPVPPDILNTAIPPVVSGIILKLLSKTPEERYQNGFGIMADLKKCIEQVDSNGEIEEFEIGRNDISIKFIIPQVIYGRDKEIDTLMSSFERIRKGASELMLVSGHPGIGKSALINEIHKPIVAQRGYFISGKYEQFKKDVPFSAIIQSFQGLIIHILAEGIERINIWKRELLQALGSNGKYLTSAIPRLELIIGKQPDIPEPEGDEGINQFNLVFKNFINVFAQEDHPLVLFLDDMQWVDAASLALVRELLANSDVKYLLLILSYRDTEVDETHTFARTLEKIKKEGIQTSTILMKPLDEENVNKIIYNFFRCEANESLPLAELIYKKTNGNPFFVNHFLKSIYDGGMLELDTVSGWKWNIEKINQMQVTDNVVEFMTGKIASLPRSVQEILQICACIGNRFDLETLAVIVNKSIEETLSCLTSAIEEGLISLFGDIYRFHHDRIQEAAYSLLSEEEKADLHYKIGNYLLENTKDSELEEKIQYIANQLNSGRARILNQEEKYRLAELNMMAAKKAKRSGAFESSLSFLRKGIELLGENSWNERYDLILLYNTETAIAAYRLNDHEEMEKYFRIVRKHAKDVLDMQRVFELKIVAYTNKNRLDDAIRFGLEVLELLGIHLSKSQSKLNIMFVYLKMKPYLSKKRIKYLHTLPELQDKYKISIIRIMTRLILTTMTTSQPLLILTLFKCYQITIKYGLTVESAPALASTGAILCSVFGDIDIGYTLCKECIELFKNSKYYWGVLHLFNATVRYWKEHLRDSLNPIIEIHRSLLQSGDIQTSALSLTVYAGTIYTGMELSALENQFKIHSSILTRMGFTFGVVIYQIYRQQIQNLTGGNENRNRIAGDMFNLEKTLPILNNFKATMLICIGHLHELIAAYTYDDFIYALKSADLAKKYVESIMEIHVYPIFIFYDSIARLGIFPDMNRSEQKQLLIHVKNNQKKMKLWAHHAPMNFQHKYYLIEAELCRVRGKDEAIDNYVKAAEGALKNEYINDAALAFELAAKFQLAKGKNDLAQTYMNDSIRYYMRWGAAAKVKDLQEKYPSLIHDPINKPSGTGILKDMAGNTGTTGSQTLDLATVIKTLHSITSEIDLGKLLNNIMKLAIENAGAQHGYLILENEDDKKLYIEAAGKIDEAVEVLKSIPVEGSNSLSVSVVHYVYKTGENIVLNDATGDERFTNDPYIIANHPKSILCTPIRHKGTMSVILYLENNLTTNAFTPERLELLQILSAQAAISIENSRLIVQREVAAKLETEMKIATSIQSTLLPDNPAIDGYEITAYMKPADDIGGDYYDVINIGDNDWVIIGDVSGHGVPAGLVMMMVQSSIQTLVRKFPEIKPSGLLSIVNETITYNVNKMKDQKYMTITAFSFGKDGRAVYSGLHQDILVYRKSSENVEIIPSEGLWLSPWDLGRANIDKDLYMKRGDVLLLYTDGITEAMDSRNIMFSQNRLLGILKQHGKLNTDAIRDKILEALQGYILNDDVTMVLMKKK